MMKTFVASWISVGGLWCVTACSLGVDIGDKRSPTSPGDSAGNGSSGSSDGGAGGSQVGNAGVGVSAGASGDIQVGGRDGAGGSDGGNVGGSDGELEFECADGELVPGSSRCNGIPECQDASDESALLCREPPRFVCSDGTMLAKTEGPCDQVVQCPDGSDETEERCRSVQFACPDGTLLLHAKRCDGAVDCSDGSDETCEDAAFRCNDGEFIGGKQRCDGKLDCFDDSDELDCPAN